MVSRMLTWLAVVFATSTALAGGVERRLLVRSNPPGALLKIDDEEIGITPVSTSFIYYGTRKIQLIKDGYETLTLLQPIPAPWYQWPGIDFFSEHLVPRQIRDTRVLDYQLQPAAMVPVEQLVERANQLRRNAQAGAEVVPVPGAIPAAPAPGQPGAWPPPPPVQPLPPPMVPAQPPATQPPLWPGQPTFPPAPAQSVQPQPGWQPALR
ncbi:MAG: PEGA domain-containing protein [Planctomycetes bacterium]|nr:PEGA domain-containing protein [Planctomycetota bacterium]